jgi:hypothetical protein
MWIGEKIDILESDQTIASGIASRTPGSLRGLLLFIPAHVSLRVSPLSKMNLFE